MTGALYSLLLPREKTGTQEYWSEHIAILRSAAEGIPYHLGTLSALLAERFVVCKEEPTRSSGLLLVQIAATTWQIVRILAGISGDEREWFKQHAPNPDSPAWAAMGVPSFFDQMHEIFEIASFLRHPRGNLATYDWVFHGTWPMDKADSIIEAAGTLHSVVNLAVNEFALAAGWAGDATKKTLHDTAMQQWAKHHASDGVQR